jgi:translation elongation factor EF-1alpha
MDSIDWNLTQYEKIKSQFSEYAKLEGVFKDRNVLFIPISGFKGENLIIPESKYN